MGPQSQQRLSLFQRTQQMKGRPRRVGPQQTTLMGGNALNPIFDCIRCAAKFENRTAPHRGHHPRCKLNRKTKGVTNQRVIDDAAYLSGLAAKMAAPLLPSEKGQGKNMENMSAEAWQRYFSVQPTYPQQTRKESVASVVTSREHTPSDVQTELLARVKSVKGNLRAPNTIQALAEYVTKTCLERKRNIGPLKHFFTGMTFTVPPCSENTSALYHSVVGQKLLVVDWELFFPKLTLCCPHCNKGKLKRGRSTFSHNNTIFPIFGLDGPPAWALVQVYRCEGGCGCTTHANNGNLLAKLPPFASAAYPVEPKYARGIQHIDKNATSLFDELMLTYGNGDLCARLLYKAINRNYKDKAMSYFSMCDALELKAEKFPEKDGEFLTAYPPQGDTIRAHYNEATSSDWHPWQLSDHDRHILEMQSVSCDKGPFVIDHTFQVCKNYPSTLKAKAMWTCAKDTGEILATGLVKNTKTVEIAHAAEQLVRRTGFSPTAIYTDTWPHKDDFWELLLGNKVQGRLGLYHFEQRITKTLRQRHYDHGQAMKDLLNCFYEYHDEDLNKLLAALKDGTLSSENKEYTDDEIADMMNTKIFRDRYDQYLRKVIRGALSIILKLEQFCVDSK